MTEAQKAAEAAAIEWIGNNPQNTFNNRLIAEKIAWLAGYERGVADAEARIAQARAEALDVLECLGVWVENQESKAQGEVK